MSTAAPRPIVVERSNSPRSDAPVLFSIVTLVTSPDQYADLQRSLRCGGFEGADCEYLYIDNSSANAACAYRGLNALLNEARGTYVIMCHQDIRLLDQSRQNLELRLSELESRDPSWALAGNAGGVRPGELAIRITDPHGADQNTGNFPARVTSLDENFIVMKRAARFGFSTDLSGFHFYGADICLNAAMSGYRAYVIDFHLAHLSGGNKDAGFAEMERAFRDKWQKAISPRWIQTTCSLVRLSGTPAGQMAGRLTSQPLAKLSRHMSHAKGWKS